MKISFNNKKIFLSMHHSVTFMSVCWINLMHLSDVINMRWEEKMGSFYFSDVTLATPSVQIRKKYHKSCLLYFYTSVRTGFVYLSDSKADWTLKSYRNYEIWKVWLNCVAVVVDLNWYIDLLYFSTSIHFKYHLKISHIHSHILHSNFRCYF